MKPEWVIKLEAEPCECVRCPDCNGNGHVMSDWDDFIDIEPCGMCRGGIVEECDRCMDLCDYDEEEA